MSRRTINQENNFEAFKEDFVKDTGLTIKDNLSDYLQYANFRINDRNYQLNLHIMAELVDLPGLLAFNLGKSPTESK